MPDAFVPGISQLNIFPEMSETILSVPNANLYEATVTHGVYTCPHPCESRNAYHYKHCGYIAPRGKGSVIDEVFQLVDVYDFEFDDVKKGFPLIPEKYRSRLVGYFKEQEVTDLYRDSRYRRMRAYFFESFDEGRNLVYSPFRVTKGRQRHHYHERSEILRDL